MENLLSFLSTINQVPTMTLILIFVFGLILGLMVASGYETYKYTKFLNSLKPKIIKLETNLRKMRELNDQIRFVELQRAVEMDGTE